MSNNNLPPGCNDWDSDAPWNQADYEYTVDSYDTKNGYLEIGLTWETGTPDDEVYFPQVVRIDLEKIHELIDEKLGR